MSLSSACSYESIWNEKKKLRKGFLILCPLVGARKRVAYSRVWSLFSLKRVAYCH